MFENLNESLRVLMAQRDQLAVHNYRLQGQMAASSIAHAAQLSQARNEVSRAQIMGATAVQQSEIARQQEQYMAQAETRELRNAVTASQEQGRALQTHNNNLTQAANAEVAIRDKRIQQLEEEARAYTASQHCLQDQNGEADCCRR